MKKMTLIATGDAFITRRLVNSPLLIETLTNSSKVPHNERVKSAAQAAVEEE